MRFSKIILDTINAEYQSGLSQEEIAARHHISQAHVQRIISGKANLDNLRLETLEKMFPDAVLYLNGDNVSIHADQNRGAVVGVNRGTITPDRDILSEIEKKILAADELSSDEKVKFLMVLKKG